MRTVRRERRAQSIVPTMISLLFLVAYSSALSFGQTPASAPALTASEGPNSESGQTLAAFLQMPSYAIAVSNGIPPQLRIERDGEPMIEVPLVAALATPDAEETLSQISFVLHKEEDGSAELIAIATSNLWKARRFVWHFLPERVEFQQFAEGHGKLGRCHFFSSGVSQRWSNGTAPGHRWETTLYADRYFSPSPNHANQFEFNIAMPQILGFNVGRMPDSEEDFRPERMTGLFAPPPLFLAFHQDKSWMGIGLGAKPGDYQFPALEYSGARYAGASFYVDYMGYMSIDGEFASPTMAITFAYNPMDAIQKYTA